MKGRTTGSSRKNAPRSQRGKNRTFVSKVVSKTKKGKKVIYKEGRISKLDAKVLVSMIMEPFRPNEATIEARKLGETIRRVTVD